MIIAMLALFAISFIALIITAVMNDEELILCVSILIVAPAQIAGAVLALIKLTT